MDRNLQKESCGVVSIIIPTHNRADLISETLDSIRRQTYKYIEVIVVDDNSDDSTLAVLEHYKLENPDFNLHVYKNDGKGACAARNKGIIASKGEYLQFFDDDDLMFENHIARKVQAIETGEYDYAACDFSYFDDVTKECLGHKVISTVEHNCSTHLLTKSFPCPCYMCKRQTISTMGFWDESIKKLQDMVFFQRLFLLGMRGIYLQDELFDVRVHEGSMTSFSIASPEGYYNQYYAYGIIDKEWSLNGDKEKSNVHRSLLFLKYTVTRNMYKKGFKKQGLKLCAKTFYENIPLSIEFLKLFIKHRTIHLTNILANESSMISSK